MTDQVNEAIIEPTTDTDNLFLDGFSEDEPKEETEEIVVSEDDQSEEATEETVDEEPEEKTEDSTKEFLEIKFKGKTQAVSKEEAIQLAQKGMNYDNVYNENTALKEERAQLEILANQAGVSPREYLKKMADFQSQSLINQAASKIKEQYPDSPDELVMQVAADQVEKYLQTKQVDERKQTDDVKEKLLADIERVEADYEGYDFTNLPEEVIDDMKNGYSLYEAVTRLEKAKLIKEKNELEAKTKAINKNNSNAQKTTGKIEQKSKGPASVDDLFLSGFNS